MGRGRQKAKHTKLARELKSYSPSVDYDALERELGSQRRDDDPHADWSREDAADEYESQGRSRGR